ncbi:MAG: hypothetical protein RLZ98_283 [Pseudomonadota bacterium]|jgi:di/tricarboxylate transporter
MTLDQALLFGLFGAVLALLLWGRVRHDLVAASGLFCGVLLGVVPQETAFSGFSNPAVVIVALVLIASRAFENSGLLGLISQFVASDKRSASAHISVIAGLGAAMSAVINNVAALAMLMPVDVQAARKAARPPGLTLMPLAFATILGGMVTLIGTPPNIIASSIRQQQLGEPYGMFDFTPVGGVVAIVGVIFIALVGWRLVPHREDKTAGIDPASFEAELIVPEGAKIVGHFGAELDEDAVRADVILTGVVRGDERQRRPVRYTIIEVGDLLVVEGSTQAIAAFISAAGLRASKESDEKAAKRASNNKGLSPKADAGPVIEAKAARDNKSGDKPRKKDEDKASRGPQIIEAVVRYESPLIGRSAASANLRSRFDLTLLGVARSGRLSLVGNHVIRPGDELLLAGRNATSDTMLRRLGLLAVNRVHISTYDQRTIFITLALFAAAIAAATVGLLSFTVAIAIAVTLYAALGIVPAREFYTQIEWPIVVMLACLLPLGAAFENVGGTALMASWITVATEGQSPIVALVLIMVITMALSDVLNNVATIVIAGPVAIGIAQQLNVNPDTFLMGVAIAASCAFLTPIGHKNNTLIMGPGGFRFSDYWQMGLPLELVVLVVSVPMLLFIWPL